MKYKFLVALVTFFFLSSVGMAKLYTAEKYIDDVQSGRQVACKWVKLAVKRHLNDLKRVGNSDFPYHFDEHQAKRVIDFVQNLKHIQGKWANPRLVGDTRIKLEPWQQFIYWCLFGWRREDGFRRFTKGFIEVARKNGKSTMAAALADYCFAMDRPKEIGPEIFFVATKKDQAAISWSIAKMLLEKHPFLRKKVKVYKQKLTVTIPGTPSKMLPLGEDSNTEDGHNPHVVIVDEHHEAKDNAMIEVMESGIAARDQPLILIITTAGLDKSCVCYREEHALSEQVLEGTLDVVPENFFCIIFTLDDGDDWTDSSVWIKSNPNLGVSVKLDYLEVRIRDALLIPSKQNKIKTKNLNLWTQAETRWILDEVWLQCGSIVDPEKLKGRQCYAGMDLSASQDITALVLCFPPVGNEMLYQFIFRFFIPEDNIIEKTRKDKVPYVNWVERGLIIPTPGNCIDYDFIEQEIKNLSEEYNILEIAFDPWKALEIVTHLQSEFTMVKVEQRYSGMAVYTDSFEKKVLKKQIAHNNNPIMRWMVACTEIKEDRQSNRMPMKPQRSKSSKRIDGVVASIMALGRAVVNEGEDYAVVEVYAS